MAAAFKQIVQPMMLPELLMEAENVRETVDTPGWKLVQDSIDAHHALMLKRLTHEGTKPEDVRYLQGLLAGLTSMREAAETILTLAKEREEQAIKEHA